MHYVYSVPGLVAMKALLILLFICINYAVSDNETRYSLKIYPKKVKPGNIQLINAGKYKKSPETYTKKQLGDINIEYTVFPLQRRANKEGIVDVPAAYFPADNVNLKPRVKKVLPEYIWTLRRKRSAVPDDPKPEETKAPVETTKVEEAIVKANVTQAPTTTTKPTDTPTSKPTDKTTEKAAAVPKEESRKNNPKPKPPQKSVNNQKPKVQPKPKPKVQTKPKPKVQPKPKPKVQTKPKPKVQPKPKPKVQTKPKPKVQPKPKPKPKPKPIPKPKAVKPTAPKPKTTKSKLSRTVKPTVPKNKNPVTPRKGIQPTTKPKPNPVVKSKPNPKPKPKPKPKTVAKPKPKSKPKPKPKPRPKPKPKLRSRKTSRIRASAKGKHQIKRKVSRRLIAGRDALIEDYPYVVSIQKDDQHWCAGALLNPRLVITTANCMWKSSRISRMEVRAGTRNTEHGGQIASISEVMKHPAWGIRKQPDHDVALVLLDRNLRFSDSIHSVDLPNRVMLPPFDDAWVTSWGAERRDGIFDSRSTTLQVYHTRLVERGKCNNITERFGVTVTKNFICLAQTGNRAPCTRDTGAPAVSDGVLWGLASWGLRKLCGTERFPAMFSYIASQDNMDFIMNASHYLMADERHYPFLDKFPRIRAPSSSTTTPTTPF